jgi:stage II sporulation protein D
MTGPPMARRVARWVLPLALLAGGLAGVRPAGAQGEIIRVSLGDGLRSADIGFPEGLTVRDAASRRPVLQLTGPQVVRVTPVGGPGGGFQLGTQRVMATAVRLEAPAGLLRAGRRDVAGAVEVWRSGDGLLLVNETGLEGYVAGVVRGEMPERWPPEAMKAMAVVARTYALFQRTRNAGRPFHLVAGSQDQQFAGQVEEDSAALQAARATAGQVLTFAGRVIPSFYHSDSGGFTEAAALTFSGEVPPLPGVRDEFSLDSPHYSWQMTLALQAVADRLRAGGVGIQSPITSLAVLDRTPSFRVARILVEHAGGTTAVRGPDFRRLVGYDVLRSTLFAVTVDGGQARFEGRGWGHGVGLSQYGAKGMAERGYAFTRILEHYYPGAVLGPLR